MDSKITYIKRNQDFKEEKEGSACNYWITEENKKPKLKVRRMVLKASKHGNIPNLFNTCERLLLKTSWRIPLSLEWTYLSKAYDNVKTFSATLYIRRFLFSR